MPGELTNVWAKSGAEPAGPFACEKLLSPVVAMQVKWDSSSSAATPVPLEHWDQGPTALPSFGVGRGKRVCPSDTWSLLEMQELDLSMLKGCLGFIPVPALRHLASNHPKGF